MCMNRLTLSDCQGKNCEEKFIEVASSPNFTFIGNVAVGHSPAHPGGQSVQLSSLLRHYDAVLFAYGASKDRTLGVPGESLKRIYSAREFVGWYNGLPEFADLRPDLSQDTALIVGQGNVALDVARILLKGPDRRLGTTDVAEYAAEALAASRVRHVAIVGRRGPMQASFTIKELRELTTLGDDVRMAPVKTALLPSDLKALKRVPRRLMEVLQKASTAAGEAPRVGGEKSWRFEFCMSPTAFLPDEKDPTAVGETVVRHNLLTDVHDPKATISYTEPEEIKLRSPLVFRSIGYKSEPIPEFEKLGILFDQRRGIIGNDGTEGRVTLVGNQARKDFPGLYCAGWVKRGPTGVIASTMLDAFATAEAIANDWKEGREFLGESDLVEGRSSSLKANQDSAGWAGVKSEGGKELAARAVGWNGWLAIDRAEKERGKAKGKEREKITAVGEMLSIATSTESK